MKLKIKPTKNTVALRKLKFRKESDFNKFLKIVSKNTKELQRIKLPSKSDVKKKSGFNAPVGAWLESDESDEFRTFNKYVYNKKVIF